MNSELQFIEAVKAGDVATVRQLIETDIFLADAKGEDGTSALLTAIYYGKEEIARMILDSAPTLTVHEAAAAGLLDQLEDILDEYPELINDVSHDGWTPLHLAVYFNRGDVAEKFPTAAIAVLDFDVAQWGDIAREEGKARLRRFVRPRDLDPALGPEF